MVAVGDTSMSERGSQFHRGFVGSQREESAAPVMPRAVLSRLVVSVLYHRALFMS